MAASVFAQQKTPLQDLPVEVAATSKDTSRPMIFYLSGDGGYNNFSQQLMKSFQSKGYPCVMLNSLKYFWRKKTPEQTATDAETIINYYKALWKRSKVILVGYSFGADVIPFVFSRLKNNSFIEHVSLVSPSPTTDFEIHTGIFGGVRNGSSVIAEINKIKTKPVIILQGEKEENKLDTKRLTIKCKVVTLKGGHHYDGNPDEVANSVLNIR